jgi:hypothetical protein
MEVCEMSHLAWSVAAAFFVAGAALGCGGKAGLGTRPSGAGSGDAGVLTVPEGDAMVSAAQDDASSPVGPNAQDDAGGPKGPSERVDAGFTAQIPNQVIDKVDLLFDIDNSASMGDKQFFLTLAIPDLIDRLINPNCVDTATGGPVGMKSSAGLGCPAGSKPEFPPVHDMHLGIVSSSLGERLSEPDSTGQTGVCHDPAFAVPPFTNLNAHADDKGHLIARSLTYAPPNVGSSATEGVVNDAVITAYGTSPSGFLYWYPRAAPPPVGSATPITVPATLQDDFAQLVTGVGTFGCGIESQLESWYRFLVQPDPYDTLALDMTKNLPTATWQGVDSVILQERHDFLRPDSLVAVVVLSDENDSEIDVRSIGGLGYLFMRTLFTPPHGTTPCATNPLDPGCHSCNPATDMGDPNCVPAAASQVKVYSAPNDWGYDPNLRHVHMRAKYGLDPQFPIARYLIGLTSPKVPNRDGEYPPGATSYQGHLPANQECTNPLFAKTLPDGSKTDATTLCNLPAGERTLDKILYAHIGGVPYQLLHFMPGNPQASLLTAQDWERILGHDPLHYDYTGIDPHMIESYQPRPGLPPPATTPSTMDPISGREWITDQPATGGHVLPVDRQYACTFKLSQARDCSLDYNIPYRCDCPSQPGGLTHEQTPPICDDNNPTSQVYAKAYPTIRELLLAKLMGNQGIVASICPQETVDTTSPVYGYRPAVAAIVDRLKAGLTHACLPRKLPVQVGATTCRILVTLPAKAGESCKNPVCETARGLTAPEPGTRNTFCDSQESIYSSAGGLPNAPGDPANQSVCLLTQLQSNADCAASGNPGWCYVEGGNSGCAQAIVFSSGALPGGSLTTLQCADSP